MSSAPVRSRQLPRRLQELRADRDKFRLHPESISRQMAHTLPSNCRFRSSISLKRDEADSRQQRRKRIAILGLAGGGQRAEGAAVE